MKTYIILSAIVLLFCADLHAQKIKLTKQEIFTSKLSRIFNPEDDLIKDSVLIYAFNFQISLERSKEGAVKVRKIVANDSLAYKIFPYYPQLSSLDYTFIGQGRNKFRVIIPVMVYFKNHNDDAMIRVDAALNAAQALFSPNAYDNEKEKYEYIANRVGVQERKNPRGFEDLQKTIFMPVVQVQILRIP